MMYVTKSLEVPLAKESKHAGYTWAKEHLCIGYSSHHGIPRIRYRQWRWMVNCPRLSLVKKGAEHTGLVQVELVFSGSLLFVHTLLLSLDTLTVALAILLLIYASRERLLVMVDPR